MQLDDNPQAGPLSIDQVLDQLEAAEPITSEEENETPEKTPEDLEVEAADAQADAEEAEEKADEQEESEPEAEEPEVYSAQEYGEIAISLDDGTQTTLADLVAGNLRHADYSRKTNDVAKSRKEVEAREAALAERERQIDLKLASVEEQEPDWVQMAEEDPLGWQIKKLSWDKKQAERSKARKEAEEAEQKQVQQFRQQTTRLALEKMPEWAEGDAFKNGAPARLRAALNAGFTEQEYNGAIDLRLAVVLEKAARYDAGQQKVKATTKKLSKVPKVIKPGASTTKADKQQAEATARKKRRSRAGGLSVNEYLSTYDL